MAMPRLILQLLLTLTLILNGISAPWAMGRMAHGDHGSMMEHGVHGTSLLPKEEGQGDAHRGHHESMVDADAPSAPKRPDSGSCCDDVSCQCGCMVPPAVSVPVFGLLTSAVAHAEYRAPHTQFVPYRDSPPLRPPTV